MSEMRRRTETKIGTLKSACGKVSRVRHMVPGGSRESLPERKVRFADNPTVTDQLYASYVTDERRTPGEPHMRNPRHMARIAGLFQALEGTASSQGQEFIRAKLIVSGNAAATAASILGHSRLFWTGFVLSAAGVAFHIIWTLLFYYLFRPVSRKIALLAAFVMLVGCAIQAVTALLYLAPWVILENGSSMGGFTSQQIQSLAFMFWKLNGRSDQFYVVFFGLWCFLTGYLIFRSTFMPKVIGILLSIDGLGWMMFVYPPLGSSLFTFIAIAAGLAEIPLLLWLLIMGVNPQRWNEQAAAAGIASNA